MSDVERKEKVNMLARYLAADRYSLFWRTRRKAALLALRTFGVFDDLEIRDAVYLADL